MGIEIPAGLQWVSYLAGEQWPKGDETAMFQIGDDWNSSSQQISDLIPKLQQAQSQTASAVSGQTASAVAGQFQSLLSGDTSIQTLVSSMSSLGSLATQTGTQIQYTKLQILSTLGIAAAEIAYALSSVEWTFGASLAWIPPIEGITIAVVRQLVSQLIKRLLAAVAETLTKTGLRQLVKDAVVGAAVGAGIGIVQDLAIEAYQIHEGVRSGIDWGQVAEISVGAVVGGALGSVAHGLLSKSIGDPSTIGGKALKGAVTHFSVGAVGNVAGAGATGGGLNAEDIFGGAGGGAVSGGIHGGKEPPKGGAHGEKDSTSDTDTSPDDDSDEASIKTLVGPDSTELPNGSNDHFPTNSPGPEGDSAGPPDGSTPPAPQESSAGPGGQPLEGDPSSNATASSAAGDTAASPGTADGLGAGRGAGVSTGEGQGSPSGSSAAGGAGAGVVSGGHDPAGAGGAGVGAGGAAASGGGSAGRGGAGSNGSGVGGHSGSAGVVDPAGASVAGRARVLSSGSAEGVARAGAVGSPNASVAGAGPDSRASRSGAASGSPSGPTAAAPAARVADTAAPKTGAGGKSGGAGQRSPEPGRLAAAQPSPGADRAAHGAGDPEEGNEFPDAVRPPVDMSQEAGHSEDSGASLPDTSDPAGRGKDSSATPSPDRSDHRPADRDDDPPPPTGSGPGRDRGAVLGDVSSQPTHGDTTVTTGTHGASPVGARSGDVLGDESWRHDPAVSADWFAPKDAVSPQQWEGRRGGAYVRSVDTEVADVKSESTPGRLTSYRGLIRYDLRRIEVAPNRFVQDYTLKVHLTPGSGVDADTVAAVRAKATAGVDGLLNRGFRLPSGDQFHVTVEFTDGPGEAHTTIEVGHTNTDQTHWNPKASASLLAHEALHYLGVPDEYVDSGRVLLRHDTNSGVHQGDGGMMGADVHGGDAGLRPRHLWIVERTANSQVAVPDTRLGDHHNPTTTARPHTPNTDTPTPNTRPTPTTNKPHTAPDGGDRRDGSEPARDRDTASDDARVSGWFDSDDDARVSGWFDSDDDARVSGWFDSGGESPTAPAGSDILHVSFDNVDGDRIERDIPTSFHPGSFGPTPPVPDPRFPTAQRGFDPTEPPVQITGVPQGRSVQHRTDTNFLFRDDHRGPLGAVDSPLERGFAVRDPSNSNLSQHVNGERNANFVSTSRDPNVAFNGPSNYKEEGRPNFRYIIHAPGGIEVNATLGPHRFGNQSEVAFPGGIRAQNIVGAQEIIGGTLRPGADTDIPGGQFENLQFGPFIPNRHFDPSAANPPGPDPRFARLTNNPGNDDSDSLFEASSSESSRPNTPPGPSRDNSGDGDSPVRRSPPPAANVPEAGPASASGSPTDVGSSAADPRLHQQVERTPNTDTPTPNTRPAPTASNALTGPDGGDRRDESESGQREPVREQLQRLKDAASRPSSLRHPMAVHSTDQLSGSASQPQRSDTDAGAGDPRHRDPAPSMPPDGQPARPDHHRSPSVGDTPRAVDPFIEALVPDEDRVSSAAGSSGNEEPEADSATRTPPPETSKPDATASASRSTPDTEEGTSRPAPTEQPNHASASTPDRAGEPRSKSEAVARNADNPPTRSTKPKNPAEPVREGPTRPTPDSEAGHEQSSTHSPPSQGLLHGFPPEDTEPTDRSRPGGDVPVLRLRGGAGEGNRFRQTLNQYARRIFGPDNQANNEDLVQGLKDKARPHSLAPDGFGPDPFGFRDPSPTPPYLKDVKLAEVPISSLGGHIHELDMAKRTGDPPPAKLDIWSESAPSDGRWFSDGRDHEPTQRLPAQLEMPKVFHSIWLGGAVTDGRKTTDLVRRNLEKLSKVAQRGGMRVVLWTDVPRTEFEHPSGDAAKMLSWARRHNISLLSPNEVFHRDEPMNLAGEYRLENAKGTAAGYTAASDILRLEILHRLGGIYTDHDNQVRRLGGLRDLLGAPGFALHSRGDGIPNNSALLSARGHPFVKQYLDQIKSNYQKVQRQLHVDVHSFVANTAKAQHENYVLKPALAIRRRSVTERTGPFNLKDVTESLNLDSAHVPRIHTDQLDMGSAHTWLSTKPLRTAPEQTSRVLQHAISGLIWDLHNREGDLNLAAVAPLIEGLPDPAAGWHAVVDFMRSVPELRSQVQTVTYAYLRPKSNVPLIGDRLRIRQLDLPKSVLDTFGLPQHERVTDQTGSWRRAAFAANIDPGVWGRAARASLSDDEVPLSFARPRDIDNDAVLHGLAAGDSATPDHAAHDADDLVQLPQPPVHEADSTQAQTASEPPTGSDRHSVDPSDSVHAERESVPGPDENTRPQSDGERRLSAFPESETSIDEIRSWIGDVNNDGDAAIAPSGPRLENCAPATMVVFDRLSGTPSFGRAYVDGLTGDGRRIHELTRDELSEATGLPLMRSTPQDIAERLVGQGSGAHTVVAIKYRNGEQHSFNAYFDGKQVHALDGQHGTIKPWPPALDRAKNPVEQWFLGTPSDSARSAPTPDSGNGSPQRVLHSLPSDGPRVDDLSGGSPDDLLFDPHSPPPSAQLDPVLSLDSVTGIPGGHSAHIRTDNVRLYRDDTRSPSEVFGTGFEMLDPTNTNLTSFVLGRPGAFVSTTRDAELNHLGPPTEARPRVFRYHIVAPGGIDVNPTLPHHQDGHEGEVAFLGGIRRENILGAEQVLGGRPGPLQLGEFVRNDHFDPRTPNPHFPADPPREPTDSPDASDDDITPVHTPRPRPASLPSVSSDTPGPLQGLPDGDGGGPEQSRPVRAQHADSKSLQRNDTTVDNVDALTPAERVDDNPTSPDTRNELAPSGSHHPAAAGDAKVGPASRLRGGATGAGEDNFPRSASSMDNIHAWFSPVDDAGDPPSASPAPPQDVLRGLPPEDPPPEDHAPPAADAPEQPLPLLSGEQRDAWSQELAQHAQGDGPSAAKGKQRDDAPQSRADAWDSYVEAFNGNQDAQLDRARGDLASWGIADPDALRPVYRDRLPAAPPEATGPVGSVRDTLPVDVDLDHEYGPLVEAKRVKPEEADPDGVAHVNPVFYRLSDMPPGLLSSHREANWHYVVDAEGHIRIGSEELGTMLSHDELTEQFQASYARPPESPEELDQFRSLIDGQGHPTIAVEFDAQGEVTGGRPQSRVSGEIGWNTATQQWEVNDKSGRYMSEKVRQPFPTQDDMRRWVDNVAARLSAHLGQPATGTLLKHADRPGDVPAKDPAKAEPATIPDDSKAKGAAAVDDSTAARPPEPPQPEPQLPERIGDNLILGGTDVVEEFRSDDEGLKHIEQVVRQLGGDAVWESNREQITALFSDDGLKPKVAGMLRGGHAPTRVINLADRTTLTISLRLDGASEQSALHFKENINKYEFEHTSDSTNTVGTFSERRTQLYGVVQGNITHPKASDTATATGARSRDVALTNQRADRQISGGQTAEPATRFHGEIQAVITHLLNTSPDEMHSRDLAYRTQVAVPTRDVTDRGEDRADETRDTVGPLPGESSRPFGPEQPSGPPRVQYTHALSGSDIVTNFSLLADDGPEAQRPPVRAARPQTVAAFVTSEPMQTAFAKAYGNKLGRVAMNETNSWLSVEQLQAHLHGMTNKQPLVLNFEGIPGARLEVHAFVEPLDTPAKTRPPEGQTEFGGAPSMMRATGTTKETEFHYGTETDTSQVHQDLVTWSAQLPTPGRFRGQGGTDAGEASGGLDGTFTRAQTQNETHTRQLRVRSTLKNPAPGQGWHGQVRLRFEMHTPDAVSPAGLGEPFKSAVHETRGRFDVLMEQSETTPTTDYLGADVWAPPKRIWGTPPLQRNSVAKSPRWRLGGTGRATTDSRHGGPPRPANLPEAPEIPRGAGKENAVPLRGMGSMDRVTNLDLSGFHGMLDSMGHKAYGSGWKNARSDVSSWYHLNRVRGSLAAMSQHSPLSRPHSPGRGPKGKDSFTADFEQLTFRRVINTLSSPSAELTQGEAITTDRNRQTSVQGALGGRGGDLNDSTVLGEAIGGISQTARDGERVRNQQRDSVATKFDQPMAVFEGWVRLDGTMTGPRATVHESGLFPVEIAIPLTELQGSRTHDSSLPPTFTRKIPTGFIDEPRPKPPPDPVDQAPLPRNPFAPKSIEHQGSPSTHGANERASTDQVPSAARPKRLQNISYVVDEDVRNNPDAYRLIDSPTTSDFPRPSTVDSGTERRGTADSTTPLIPPRRETVDSLPEGQGQGAQDDWEPRMLLRQGTVESMLDGEGIVDTRTPFVPRDRETVEIWPSREGSADGEPERRSTVDSTTPLLVQDVVDSGPDRRATIDAPPVDPPQPPLTDAADDTAPPPPPDPVRPQLDWTAPTVEDGHQPPEHAFQQGWHPSDMLVGVDPTSSLLEAIRQDLAPALGSSLDEAIGELSDQFGPSVLLARLTHESGQEWSHDIAVRGGKITVKVRPVRGSDPTDFEYVGTAKKFETDLSTESQSSTAHIYGNSLRTVVGGRIQIPVPHGSVSAQLTHTTSVRPQEDIGGRADQGLGHLSNVDFPNFTGETEYRVPARVRTTEQHDLFRQPIHFEIRYEQHVFGTLLKGVPEAPEPVRLSGTFSYPKEPPAAAGTTSADEVRGQGNSPATPRIELQVDQAVVKIRPHIHRNPNAPDGLPGAGSGKRTAKEDFVAAHILDSMTTQGTAVFGTDWPHVRAELADHVKTMTVQRELGDYSHGGAKTILLKSVRGGEVVLGAHLDSLNVADSTATTEFYSGGQQSLGAGVSNIKAVAWQGYIQAQVDILPGHEALNVSALGRLNGGIGNETVDARTESSVTGNVFRKKVATLTHVGTATIEADMSRPTGLFGFGGDRISQVGTARVDFVTRESPTDKQDHPLYVPRDGIIRNDEQGHNGHGLSRDSIVRKIANGPDVRAHTLEKLRPLNIPNISRQVHSYLNDTRLASKLGAMTRVGEGEGVEFLRRGDLRITARAEVQELKFVEIEHEGGNAYLLADITRTRLHQPTKTREAGGRVLFGPHWRLPGLQGSLLAGAGVTGRQRDAPIFGQTARVSANAKFPRSYAVFDGVSRVHLTVTYLGVDHELPPVDVHGPILIPQSETHPHIPDVVQHGVDSPDEALVAKPEPDVATPDPQPPPVAGPSTVRPEGGPGDHVARPTQGEVSHLQPDAPTEPSIHPESSTRSAGLPVAQTADAAVDASANRPQQPSDAGASTAPRASLSAPPARPESSTHPAGLPTAHTADAGVGRPSPIRSTAPPTWQPVLPPIVLGQYLGDFGMSSFLDNLNTE